MLNLFNALPWFKRRKKRKASSSASRTSKKKAPKKKAKKKAAKKSAKKPKRRSTKKQVRRSPTTGRKVRTRLTDEDLERFEAKLAGQLYDPESGELGRMATPAEVKRQMQNPDGYIRVNGRKTLVI